MRKIWMLGWMFVTAAVAGAQGTAGTRLQFDVVSIKANRSGGDRGVLQISPDGDRVIVTNAPMYRIVGFAFDFLRNDLVLGAPEWTRTERWDLEAKVAAGDLAAFHALTFVQQKAMLQGALQERCRLQAEVVKKEVPVYALVVGKGGMKMHEVQPGEELPVVRDRNGKVVPEWDLTQKHGELHARAVPMEALMYALSGASLGRQVVDRTALKGKYNFDLVWTPEDERGDAAGVPNGAQPSIFTAVQEQLGLRLEAARAMVDALSINHIERPTDN